MVVVLQEWHKLIPNYRVSDLDAVVEHSGGVYSIEKLRLAWEV